MCGIFGSPTLTPSLRRMLPYLGVQMEERGRDAWGASDGNEVVKYVGPLVDTWASEAERFDGWEAGIFHTRGASHGSAKVLDNAHPFSYVKEDGTSVIGIHNGVITNHDGLDTRYQRKCEVDSMHIWMHRAEGKPWSDLYGWGNLAWWETHLEGRRALHLCRFNNTALHVAKLIGGEYVFASTLDAIRNAGKLFGNPIQHSFTLDEFYHYWFWPSVEGKMTIWRHPKPFPFPRPTPAPVHHYSNWGKWDDLCHRCGISRTASKDHMICGTCFATLTSEFIEWKDRPLVAVS